MPITDYTGARKEPYAYRHLMSLKWNDTSVDWANRVISWGYVRREISTPQRAYSGGNDTLRLADTDQAIWGSFKGANGTEFLWSNIEIVSKLAGPDGTFTFPTGPSGDSKFGNFKFGNMRFGEALFSGIMAAGRALELTVEENEIVFSLYDDINTIKDAKFVWDYLNLKTSWSGAYYGTVHSVLNATTVVLEEAPDRLLRINLALVGGNDQWRTYTEKWERLGNLGVIGTDTVAPGDILKFHPDDIADANAGSLLLGSRQYPITLGSFVINSGVGTFGTFYLSKRLIGVNPGDFVYKRKPLIFQGNPADIVKSMITGGNTTVGLPAGSYSSDHYNVAYSATSPMDFYHEVEDESDGAVLRAIQEISEPLDAVYAFDRSGRFMWLPNRPFGRSIDVVTDYYDGTESGTNNITGRVSYSEDTEQIFTDFRMQYSYEITEDEPALKFKGDFEEYRSDTSSRYNGMRSVKNIQSKWVKDDNDAAIIGGRFLNKHQRAPRKMTVHTSLYGLEQELLDVINLSHRTGSITNLLFRVNGVNFNLDDDTVTLNLEDLGTKFGYGFWMAGTSFGSAVYGTTTLGWGWWRTALVGYDLHGFVADYYVLGIPPYGTYMELQDANGGNCTWIGSDQDTQYIVVDEEIFKVIDTGATVDKEVLRAQHTTFDSGAISINSLFKAVPHIGGEVNPCPASGTIYGAITGSDWSYGTSLNINTGSYGTVWRFF